MNEESLRVRIKLSKESGDYVDEIQHKYNFSRRNHAIEKIIEDHKNLESLKEKEEKMIDSVSSKISSEVKKEVSRVLLGVNNTDRNTQVLIELMNGMMINNSQENILTTEDHETDGVVTAKEKVATDIQKQKQKRDDWLLKQGGE
jgi:hypothetical protein